MRAKAVISKDGSLTPRGEQVKALAHLPKKEIAWRLALSPATVDVYLSALRVRGLISGGARDKLGCDCITIQIPVAIGERLRAELSRRNRCHEPAARMIEQILDAIHGDNLYDAILDDAAARGEA